MPEATIPLIFVTSFMVALSGAVMPGPLLVLTISEAPRHGFWAGPLLVIGHGVLELLLVLALALGLSELITGESVSQIVGFVGGFILIGMGLLIARRGWQKETILAADSPGVKRRGKLIASGVVASVSNPYWFIWWLTLGITYMLWSLRLGIAGVASFFTGHILADFSWYALVAFVIASGRKIITDTIYSKLLVVCGLALVALGGYFIISGFRFLGS
jgi:threonine/homoserine/homoserine lactone efflux protein